MANTGESVTFPAGSVGGGIVVTLQVFDGAGLTPPPAGTAYVSHGINLQPEGVSFDPPAIITFPYTDAELGSGDPSSLAIWVFVNGSWQSLGGTVNTANHTVSVSVPHFTLYALARTVAGSPPRSAPLPAVGEAPTGVTAVPNAGKGHGASRAAWIVLLEIVSLAVGGSLCAAGLGRRRPSSQ